MYKYTYLKIACQVSTIILPYLFEIFTFFFFSGLLSIRRNKWIFLVTKKKP